MILFLRSKRYFNSRINMLLMKIQHALIFQQPCKAWRAAKKKKQKKTLLPIKLQAWSWHANKHKDSDTVVSNENNFALRSYFNSHNKTKEHFQSDVYDFEQLPKRKWRLLRTGWTFPDNVHSSTFLITAT